jgi:hypothetical protein
MTTRELDELRERVRDYVYDCTRDEFRRGWTLSAHQTDDLIELISRALKDSVE